MSPVRTPPSASAPPPSYDGDIKLLTYKVDELGKKFDTFSADLKATYASKDELKEVRQDVHELKSSIGWVVKLALGLIITAVIGLVIVKGGAVR